MLRKLGRLVAFLAVWPSCSYSETYTYGVTGNAAIGGYSWLTDDSLFGGNALQGVDINGVSYRYTAVKDIDADMLVHIRNEDTQGGYIFSETDDWSGLPPSTINKFIVIQNSPASRWGDGSITVEGDGSVTDASVLYSYRFNPCYDPQISELCDGYQAVDFLINEADSDIYDPLSDDAVLAALKPTDAPQSEDQDDEEAEEETVELKGDADIGIAIGQAAMLQALNMATNMTAYYQANINGGVYQETVKLVDAKLPENRSGLRNGLAQQVLHRKMVDMQYEERQ